MPNNDCIICWELVPNKDLAVRVEYLAYMDTGICPKCQREAKNKNKPKKDLTDGR